MRTCKYCTKDRDDKDFYPGRAKCNTCQAAYKSDLRQGIRHPIIKPDVIECRVCHKSDVEFVPNRNICKPCNSVWMEGYRRRNRPKLRQQVQDWKDDNREHYKAQCRKHYAESDQLERQNAFYMRSPRNFLNKQLASIRARKKNPGPHDPKSGPKLILI